MTYFEALLYGFVQGITEYLPVSSSAHLILLPKFLKIDDPGLAFDVFLHLGTLLATLTYFWSDWKMLLQPSEIKSGLLQKNGVSLRLLVIATLPALVAGAVFYPVIKSTFRGEGVLVVTLVLGGLLLYFSDRLSKVKRGITQVVEKDAWVVGVFQCIALIHGMSRSGSTMSGARVLGLDRASAARFSFLMSAPITAAAALFELRHLKDIFNAGIHLGPLLVAGASSFVFGWIAIDFLLKFLKKVSFAGFAFYRILLAAFVYFVFKPF